MSSNVEMACVYAALMLQDDDVAVSGEKISALLRAANIEFEPFWPDLFAKALKDVDVKALIPSVASGPGLGMAQPVVHSDAEAPTQDEIGHAKEISKEESDDDDIPFDLFQ